jgi:hypothetical protein
LGRETVPARAPKRQLAQRALRRPLAPTSCYREREVAGVGVAGEVSCGFGAGVKQAMAAAKTTANPVSIRIVVFIDNFDLRQCFRRTRKFILLVRFGSCERPSEYVAMRDVSLHSDFRPI